MRVLLLNTLYAPHIGGGAEVMLQHMAEGLRARGHAVQVLSTGPDGGLSRDTINGVPVWRVGVRNLYWPFDGRAHGALQRLAWHGLDRYNRGMRGVLARVLGQTEPDIVVCHNLSGWSISAWDAIRSAGVPIVQVLHDQYLTCPRGVRFNKGRHCQQQCGPCALLRRSHAAASAKVDAVVGVSRFQLNTLLDAGYFIGSHQHVVYNGSPLATAPVAAPIDERRALRFGFIGALTPNKGVEWLIEQFQARTEDASLLIAGRGDPGYLNQLKSLADPLRVHFVGYRQAAEFFAEIDIAVVPSLAPESFGLVALEACAHHLPVIASRMGGLSEIVQDEINGLLVSPARADSLGDAIERLVRDPSLRQRLAARARETVEPMLSVERMLDEYEAILRHTLLTRGVQHGTAIPVSTL
ncbi:glycosyltransferase family 4 protein [Pseudomonas sp. PDNC002]|uniref:glycosyltransferase family 4 protein n=1 Tax=Pseudomonas sp. PDNC002 TaxID=2811422 RepID=UPI0019659480|nr:glycosyltransferase family 4 protein [Pseudomonas sp. PDNC002]QRY80251.1 glycosyltransferase family 4 protein [Pseudomonas sp. PDNC002]